MLTGQAAGLQTCLQDVRSVLRLSGPGLIHFLQGIVTNDVTPLEAPGAATQYACLLNAQGRHLHDMLLHRTLDAVPTVLVDADRRGSADLLHLLKRYRLRQKLDIDDVSQQYRVWARCGAAADAGPQGAAPPPGWAPDPRLRELGLRAVLPADAAVGGSSGSWQDHRQWRILHGVAEGDSEIPTGEVVPLEFNIDGLHGISFTKGCYVGQELMARTHFKGVVRKRLAPFVVLPPGGSSQQPPPPPQQLQQQGWLGASGAPAIALAAAGAAAEAAAAAAAAAGVQPGAAVYLEQLGGRRKSVGVVRVADGALGLAVVRLAAVEAAVAAGQPLLVGEGKGRAELLAWRPDWWPEGWGREEGGAGAVEA